MGVGIFVLSIWVALANILGVVALAYQEIKKSDKGMIPFTLGFIVPNIILGITIAMRGV